MQRKGNSDRVMICTQQALVCIQIAHTDRTATSITHIQSTFLHMCKNILSKGPDNNGMITMFDVTIDAYMELNLLNCIHLKRPVVITFLPDFNQLCTFSLKQCAC